MSVTTTADEKLYEARDHLKQALVAVNAIIIDEVWGHDEYTSEFDKRLRRVHKRIMKTRSILGE